MATEHEFFAALKTAFPDREYVLVPQVRNGTGFTSRTRTADALAVSCWPSRGIYAHGFEFKDSRSDWLRELKDPAKAEEIGRWCRFWTIVASDAGVVADGELPPAWGLSVLDGKGGVKSLVKPPARTPEEPGWNFVAAVLRAAAGAVTGETEVARRVAAEVAKANEGIYQRIDKARQEERAAARKSAEEQAARIREFEAASGVRLNLSAWGERDNKKIGEAVKFVLERRDDLLRMWLSNAVEQCDRVKAQAERALAEMSAAPPAPGTADDDGEDVA